MFLSVRMEEEQLTQRLLLTDVVYKATNRELVSLGSMTYLHLLVIERFYQTINTRSNNAF